MHTRLPITGLLQVAAFTFMLSFTLPVFAIPFSNMYVFGDSLSDNGNLYTWTDNPNPVTGGTPIPISAYYLPGRFQNGPNYAELLWSQLGLGGNLTPSLLGGTNYAVGGARSRYHNFDLDSSGLPPTGSAPFEMFGLLGQLGQYHNVQGMTADPNALYVVWAGSNDLQDALMLAGAGYSAEAQSRLIQAVGDAATVVATLASEGAQRLLVPNLPDFGVVPAVRAAGPQAQAVATAFSQAYNNALDQALAGLVLADPSLSIVRFDVFDLVQEMINDPDTFGLTNLTDPCLQNFYVVAPLDPNQSVSICSTQEDYLFWDVVHPSARTHEILAAGMSNAVPEPASTWLLGLGLTGLIWARKLGRLKPQVAS